MKEPVESVMKDLLSQHVLREGLLPVEDVWLWSKL